MSKSLEAVQAALQQAILTAGSSPARLIRTPPKGTTADDRLEVYRAGYGIRLGEFLAHDHPMLRLYMGETGFKAMALAYIAAHPSDTPNARWYSRHLPEFLAKSHSFARKRELPELAELERALNDAFDAPDCAIVSMADLAAVDPAEFAGMGFALSTSLVRLRVKTNVTSLWASLRCDMPPPPAAALPEPQDLMVWRQGTASRFRMLGAEEAMAVDATAEGVPFAVICEMIAAMDDPDTAAVRAATYLRGWIEAEIIAGLRASVPEA